MSPHQEPEELQHPEVHPSQSAEVGALPALAVPAFLALMKAFKKAKMKREGRNNQQSEDDKEIEDMSNTDNPYGMLSGESLASLRDITPEDFDDGQVIGFDRDEDADTVGTEEEFLEDVDLRIQGFEEDIEQDDVHEAISGEEEIGASIDRLNKRIKSGLDLIKKLQTRLATIPAKRKRRRKKIRNRINRVTGRVKKLREKLTNKMAKGGRRRDRRPSKNVALPAAGAAVTAAAATAAFAAAKRRPRNEEPTDEVTHHAAKEAPLSDPESQAVYQTFAPEGMQVPLSFNVHETGNPLVKMLLFGPGDPSTKIVNYRIEGKGYADLRLMAVRVQVRARGVEQFLTIAVTELKVEGAADASYGDVARLVPAPMNGEQGFCDLWVACLRNNDQLNKHGDLKLTCTVSQLTEIKDKGVEVAITAIGYFQRLSDSYAENN